MSLICEGTEIWNWLSSCFKREWNPTFRAFTIMSQSCIALCTVATFQLWHMSSTMCSKMPIPPIAKLPLLKSPWKQATPKWLNSSLLKAHTTLLAMCWTTSSPNNSRLKSPANTRPSILEGKLAMLWLLKILRLRTVPLRKLWGGQESGNLFWWKILLKKWPKTGEIMPWMKKLWSRKKNRKNRLKKWTNNSRRKSQNKIRL